MNGMNFTERLDAQQSHLELKMMLRNVVRLHTVILVATSLALLIAPSVILEAFGITNASFAVLSLTRVLAGLIGVLAAAVYPVPDLPAPARGQALTGLAVSYALLAALITAQQVAIWSNLAGTVLTAECLLHTAAFAWLAVDERRSVSAGV